MHTLLRALAAAIFLLPLAWMILAATGPAVGRSGTAALPEAAVLSGANFERAASLVPLGSYAWNSILVALVAVPLTVFVSGLTAFAVSQLSRAGQSAWVVLLLALLMVPEAALWLPRFFIYRGLGWLDSPWALAAPAWIGASPFFILMFYRAFRRIPAAYFETARIEGAGMLDLFGRVALPMARPTALGVALLSLVYFWGEASGPLLYLYSESEYTLPVGLKLLQELGRSDWPVLMAGGLLAAALPVAVFLLAQPFFARIGGERG